MSQEQQQRYKVTEKGTLRRADEKLAEAEYEIRNGYIDVSDRFAAIESIERGLELIAETRRALQKLGRGSKWSTPRDTRLRSQDLSLRSSEGDESDRRTGRDRRGG